MTDAVVFKNVDIIFGNNPQTALQMVDQGKTRDEIGAATGLVLGVAGASLAINEGEILVLMGLSGSGKSTLLRAVNGLAPVVRGEVEVKTANGPLNPYRTTPKSLRDFRMHTVSMVFQQFALLPWRTVADNVGFGLELAGMPDAERKARVGEQLELVNLTKWADRKVNELSGGMQQRVGLARAFATGAPILLMDEPFSALDPLIRTRLQDELLEFQRRLKKTIVFVSHDLDEAFRIGNRIAIMEGGRIIQCGTPQDIVKKPGEPVCRRFRPAHEPDQHADGKGRDADRHPTRSGRGRRDGDRQADDAARRYPRRHVPTAGQRRRRRQRLRRRHDQRAKHR